MNGLPAQPLVVLVATLLLAVGCAEEEPETLPPPEEPPPEAPETTGTPDPEDDPEEWASCSNPDHGFAVAYPAGWSTNTEPIDELPPCSLFDPEPAQLRAEGMELPADIAVSLHVEDAPFTDVAGEDPFADELDREEATVDGFEAVRTENEATGEGLYPQGSRYTVWAVDLHGQTFVGQTFDIGEPGYERTQQILDRMVASLSFDEGMGGEN